MILNIDQIEGELTPEIFRKITKIGECLEPSIENKEN
jgi:hypothetical protein